MTWKELKTLSSHEWRNRYIVSADAKSARKIQGTIRKWLAHVQREKPRLRGFNPPVAKEYYGDPKDFPLDEEKPNDSEIEKLTHYLFQHRAERAWVWARTKIPSDHYEDEAQTTGEEFLNLTRKYSGLVFGWRSKKRVFHPGLGFQIFELSKGLDNISLALLLWDLSKFDTVVQLATAINEELGEPGTDCLEALQKRIAAIKSHSNP